MSHVRSPVDPTRTMPCSLDLGSCGAAVGLVLEIEYLDRRVARHLALGCERPRQAFTQTYDTRVRLSTSLLTSITHCERLLTWMK